MISRISRSSALVLGLEIRAHYLPWIRGRFDGDPEFWWRCMNAPNLPDTLFDSSGRIRDYLDEASFHRASDLLSDWHTDNPMPVYFVDHCWHFHNGARFGHKHPDPKILLVPALEHTWPGVFETFNLTSFLAGVLGPTTKLLVEFCQTCGIPTENDVELYCLASGRFVGIGRGLMKLTSVEL